MVEFVCDSAEVESLLRKQCALIVACGGMLDDRLTITCESGELRIKAQQAIPDKDRLIFLPARCLVPIGKFDLRFQGNRLVIGSHEKGLTEVQIELMEAMTLLFNLTRKLAQQKKVSVFGLYHRNRSLMDAILNCRSYDRMALYKQAKNMDHSHFIFDEFIKSRRLVMGEDNGTPTEYWAPIIDCLNHHPKAAGVAASASQGREGLTVFNSPIGSSHECYVNYGPFDAADTFIFHHFVDRNAPFVRSVPMRIEAPGIGLLRVDSLLDGPNSRDIPEPTRDLGFYLPDIEQSEDRKTVSVSFLLIPQKGAPRALRRVLTLSMSKLTADHDRAEQAALYVEKQVIRENMRHYTELLAYLDSYRANASTRLIVQNAREMAKTQLDKIAQYPFFGKAQ